MPSAEDAIFTLLTAGSPNPVAALIADRAYLNQLEQGVTYPAIRYQRISTPRAQYKTMDGTIGYASPRFQIDCWSPSSDQVIALAAAVRMLVIEIAFYTIAGLRIDTATPEDEAGDVEEDIGPNGARVFRQRLDVIVYHAE